MIDLSKLSREITHTIEVELEDGAGIIKLLLTISGTAGTETITDLANYTPNPREREQIIRNYVSVRICLFFNNPVVMTVVWGKWLQKKSGVRRKEGNILFNDALNTFYEYIVLNTWQKGPVREESHCSHYMGYSFWLAARIHLYAPSHRQDNTAFVIPGKRDVAPW